MPEKLDIRGEDGSEDKSEEDTEQEEAPPKPKKPKLALGLGFEPGAKIPKKRRLTKDLSQGS